MRNAGSSRAHVLSLRVHAGHRISGLELVEEALKLSSIKTMPYMRFTAQLSSLADIWLNAAAEGHVSEESLRRISTSRYGIVDKANLGCTIQFLAESNMAHAPPPEDLHFPGKYREPFRMLLFYIRSHVVVLNNCNWARDEDPLIGNSKKDAISNLEWNLWRALLYAEMILLASIGEMKDADAARPFTKQTRLPLLDCWLLVEWSNALERLDILGDAEQAEETNSARIAKVAAELDILGNPLELGENACGGFPCSSG